LILLKQIQYKPKESSRKDREEYAKVAENSAQRTLRFFKTLRDPFNTANNLRKVHAENAEFTAESAK
jgi:hypothetical protein